MKVEQQGYNECLLATIAALSNTPLKTVRKYACERAGYEHWSQMIDNVDAGTYWIYAKDIAYLFGGPDMWALIGPAGSHVPGSSVSELDTYGMRKLPDKGRGTITFKSKRRGVRISHIAPWKDGLIYDPENPKTPMTFRQYLKLRPRMKVWTVTIED